MSDFSDIRAIERRIIETVAALQALVPSLAESRQVKEFMPDMKKNLLARYMSPLEGKSAASAEVEARADEGYIHDFAALTEQYTAAEATIAKWQALMARLDAARSLLAVSRETLRQMPEATGT